MAEYCPLGEAVSDIAVAMAARDPDLVGYIELQLLQHTDAVPQERAEELKRYDTCRLQQELRDHYFLSPFEVGDAVRKALQNYQQEPDEGRQGHEGK